MERKNGTLSILTSHLGVFESALVGPYGTQIYPLVRADANGGHLYLTSCTRTTLDLHGEIKFEIELNLKFHGWNITKLECSYKTRAKISKKDKAMLCTVPLQGYIAIVECLYIPLR